MGVCKTEIEYQKNNRLGEKKLNNQGCLMKIVEYNKAVDIVVEFQDEHKAIVCTQYSSFQNGSVKNPYHPSVYGVGIVGEKYKTSVNYKHTKEYQIWTDMLGRCFDENLKTKWHTYKDVTCCDEWLYYEKFYEWLHSQPNFEKWLNVEDDTFAIDKDILIKGNKVYSPETCCLVPHNVNSLFLKHNKDRGDLPIGVVKSGNKFQAKCMNPFTNKTKSLGIFPTSTQAFQAYKQYKESVIKQVAQIEYDKGNITKRCYDAMINYRVEIDD